VEKLFGEVRETVSIKRTFDLSVSFLALFLLSVPLIVIYFLVKLTSEGPAIYWTDRVGVDNAIFKMPKFRTMRTDVPQVATHLLRDPDRYITSLGRFLRRASLDELPQLYSIFCGDMSFVGPRPALFNQTDLVDLRTAKGVHRLVPGLTGWAQVNGRDELSIPVKVEFDAHYLQHRSFWFDQKILVMTVAQAIVGRGVSH